MNVRLGDVDEARYYLDRAYRGGPFDIFARNTLELIDEYSDFVSTESEHFTLVIHKSENEVLEQPILALAEECYDSLSVRYRYTPGKKIRLEAYNDHDDFAVRISGLPGIGLLGVCFGEVVAFDTPKAQTGSDYNWADTLWHEIAHVMSLGISDNRVPRWFTEGVSVYEEKRARPECRRNMELELYTALDQDLLLSIRDINKGFTRPMFPEQVMITYYQSARLIEFIANQYGFSAIVDLLTEFGNEKDLDNAFKSVLGATPEEIDTRFFDDLEHERNKYERVLTDLPPILSVQTDEKSARESTREKSKNPFFKKISTRDMSF